MFRAIFPSFQDSLVTLLLVVVLCSPWRCLNFTHRIYDLASQRELNQQELMHWRWLAAAHMYYYAHCGFRVYPEFHFVLHLPEQVEQSGVPRSFWVYSDESKNAQVKRIFRICSKGHGVCQQVLLRLLWLFALWALHWWKTKQQLVNPKQQLVTPKQNPRGSNNLWFQDTNWWYMYKHLWFRCKLWWLYMIRWWVHYECTVGWTEMYETKLTILNQMFYVLMKLMLGFSFPVFYQRRLRV